MAGHSKWHNIQFRKKLQDKKKSNHYHKYSNELRQLARKNNNPETNHKLAAFIELCKKKNIPNNLIEQAIDVKKTTGENILYQCVYGNYGFLIDAYTDNRNRTSSLIKSVLNKYGGQIQKCSYMFKYTNIITCDFVLNDVIDYIEDFDESSIECNNDNFNQVIKLVDNIKDIFSGYVPLETIESNESAEELYNQLLENVDEIENLYINF